MVWFTNRPERTGHAAAPVIHTRSGGYYGRTVPETVVSFTPSRAEPLEIA